MKNTRLAQMLKSQQNKSGMTETEIGERYGFSQQAFSTWKTGVAPRPKMFAALAEFMKISEQDVANLVAEAKASSGNTKLPDMGAPVLGQGSRDDLTIDKFASGFAKPAVGGTYALKVDGKHAWINPRLKPADGNEVVIRAGTNGRIVVWPVKLKEDEEAHVIVLRETV